jgi:hypothetical protein
MTEEKQWQNHMNERKENTLFFLKHLTISTIRKVSATIQAYGLPEYASLLCLHWHRIEKYFQSIIHTWLVYSLVFYLFIKQDQMILTCNSAVASLMLSQAYTGINVGIHMI